MSRFLSLKLLATVGSKSRAVTKFRAAAATGAGSNLVRHFSLGQALGVNLVEPQVINFETDRLPIMRPWDADDDPPSIAVILSGCGHLDGTDVHEAVYTMMHLHKAEKHASLFAPTGEIAQVFNHVTGVRVPQAPARNILKESARLKVDNHELNNLENLRVEDHEGLIIPGGDGIVRILTDYYTRRQQNDAHSFDMDETLNHKLIDFYRHGKPIGFVGIASILAARVFQGVDITFGNRTTPEARAADTEHFIINAEAMGATVNIRKPSKVLHCQRYNVYSTGSRLTHPTPHSIYHDVSQGIGKLVDHMVQSIRQNNR